MNAEEVEFHKCTGPSHAQPVYLEVNPTNFYFRKSGPYAGTHMSRCKRCVNWHKLKVHRANHGTIPARRMIPYLREIVGRVGKQDAARRIGISHNALWHIRTYQVENVHAETAARILATLRELRRAGIARHKDSIAHGSYIRGRKEKRPRRAHEYYDPKVFEHAQEQLKSEKERKKQERQNWSEERKRLEGLKTAARRVRIGRVENSKILASMTDDERAEIEEWLRKWDEAKERREAKRRKSS